MLQSQKNLFNLSNFVFKIHWRQNASLNLLDNLHWKEDPEMIWKWTEKLYMHICIYIYIYIYIYIHMRWIKDTEKWMKRVREANRHPRHIEHPVCCSMSQERRETKWNGWELIGGCRPERRTWSGVEFSYNAQAWNLAKNSLPVTYYYSQKLWSKHLP